MKNFLFSGLLLLLFSNIPDNGTKNSIQSFFEPQIIQNVSKFTLPDTITFCGESVPLHIQRVKEYLEREFYLTLDREGQVLLYMKRSGRYFPVIEDKLREAGLPNDLKYLPIAESALINQTSNKGAEGYWQLMEATAERMGLTVNDYVDERLDIHKSTDAALKYLKKMYAIFNNWALAAAAYNAGPENIKNNLDFQWKDNYYDLYLNDETSRFVFRIIALKIIFSDSRKYGITINDKDYYKSFETQTVKVKEEIPNLAVWAMNHGTSYLDVKMLNRWITGRNLPKGEYDIQVPKNAQVRQIDMAKYPYKEKIHAPKKVKSGKKKKK
jgi:membrane-bound lytic murein transglycosylase D